jgi:hypothetical protein
MEKAKGLCTKIEKKTSAAGKDYYFATVGGVRLLIFDKKIEDYQDKEVELEYTIKTDDKGTTFMANFPGAAKTGGGSAPRKGTTPEELKQKAIDMKLRTKTMVFSYAKDIVLANCDPRGTRDPEAICKEMDVYIKYMLGLVAGNIKELEG